MREIIGDYESFIQNIDSGLTKLGIDSSELAMMDHVCYRVETEKRYNEMVQALVRDSVLLGEASVGGRQIATFELRDYLRASGWIVPYIELPEPKEGSPYAEGLEHAELVVVGGLERFMARHRGLPFNLKGMSKSINPEAGLKAEGISVKFHEQPLGAVVRIEQRLGL